MAATAASELLLEAHRTRQGELVSEMANAESKAGRKGLGPRHSKYDTAAAYVGAPLW